ncbi:DUF397 domain-containing protein [Streptomyces sp. NPDC056061]|uniref:DUF397 domain-containing protein n=1 Tax=Streptomyces sp. NPDC056061 TaxID=3345700 RepID=UPI0035D68911
MIQHELSAAAWRKSSYSSAQGQCVEVAICQDAGAVGTRDSKNPSGPALLFAPSQWSAFITGVTCGKLGG